MTAGIADPDSPVDSFADLLADPDRRWTLPELMDRNAELAPHGPPPHENRYSNASQATLDRYGHLMPDELDNLADALDGARAEALAASPRPERGLGVVGLDDPRPVNPV